ncbi:MAG: hypothetical protein AAB225_25000 [Acidobacteriota bacterium]
MNLTPHLVSWGVLAVVLLVLISYRSRLAGHEDDTIHVLDGDAGMVTEQVALAKKLTVVERWGKILTVVVVIYGLAIAGLYCWNLWEQSSKVVM